MAGVKGKSGRHKSEVKRKGFFLRLQPGVIDRVKHCTPRLEIQQGVRMNQAEALECLLIMGCEAVEPPHEGKESRPILKISEISGDDVNLPGFGFPEDEDKTPAPQATETPSTVAPASKLPTSHRNRQRTSAHSARAISLETLKAIAAAATEYDKLSFAQLAQLLYERNIYRTKEPTTGQEKPLNKGTLKKWIERARIAGLL